MIMMMMPSISAEWVLTGEVNLFTISGGGVQRVVLMAEAVRSLHVAKVTLTVMAWRVVRTGRAYPWCV